MANLYGIYGRWLANIGIYLRPKNAGQTPLKIQLPASATGNIIEAVNSSGTTIYAVGPTGTCDPTITSTLAAGDKGLSLNITQNSTALTGTLEGAAITATNGTTAAASGTIRGIEIKARAATSANVGARIGTLTSGYFSADAKNKQADTMRGVEISLDGGAGGSSTTATGLVINNNSSATQTTSYGITFNDGEGVGGHKVFTYDIMLQYGETIDNATDGTVQITSNIIKHAYDSSNYLSQTCSSTGGVTLTCTGSATNKITVSHTLTSTTPSFRGFYSLMTTASSAASTSGAVTGVRGEVNLGHNFGNGAAIYAYGVQGKLITNSRTITAGSGHVCAVMAQVDYSGATLTSGHIACLVCSVQNSGAVIDATKFNGIYIEVPTFGAGNWVNSYIEMYGGSHYVFSIQGPSTEAFVTASDTTLTKKLKIVVDSTPYFICCTTNA